MGCTINVLGYLNFKTYLFKLKLNINSQITILFHPNKINMNSKPIY
jgi:hypothetical protein